uniref:Uncharacterized protein n=1 Tax=Panagrolaimus davidi TaxID=227884 RepID=A0A914PLP8_9BILA
MAGKSDGRNMSLAGNEKTEVKNFPTNVIENESMISGNVESEIFNENGYGNQSKEKSKNGETIKNEMVGKSDHPNAIIAGYDETDGGFSRVPSVTEPHSKVGKF